jgi:hypothetical protein
VLKLEWNERLAKPKNGVDVETGRTNSKNPTCFLNSGFNAAHTHELRLAEGLRNQTRAESSGNFSSCRRQMTSVTGYFSAGSEPFEVLLFVLRVIYGRNSLAGLASEHRYHSSRLGTPDVFGDMSPGSLKSGAEGIGHRRLVGESSRSARTASSSSSERDPLGSY